MRASISKSEIGGRVVAPTSKSYTIRGLLCASLARGDSEIVRPLGSDDTEASLDVLGRIGVSVRQGKDLWQVSGGDLHEPQTDLFCRDSALTFRSMTAIAAIVPGRCRLTAGASLARRPIEPLVHALRQVGVECRYEDEKACVVVKGGRLKGGVTSLAGDISSQFVSALLLVSPFAESGMTIRLTTPLESKPYVLMTLECLRLFGVEVKSSEDLAQFETARQAYRPATYVVEGDWSSASYLLALGALTGETVVTGLNMESLQGDRRIVDLIREMGASVATGENAVTVRRSRLKAIRADLTDCIDLLPTLAAVSAVAEGRSEFTGIERARLKESNRVLAVKEGLESMGIEVVEGRDSLTVTGGRPRGAIIDSRNDHRVAMAFSLLGTVAGATMIGQAECVGKTYPGFWEALKSLGGKVKLDGQ